MAAVTMTIWRRPSSDRDGIERGRRRGRKQRELGFGGGVPLQSRARGAVDGRHGAMPSVDVLHDASLLQVEENQCGLGLRVL